MLVKSPNFSIISYFSNTYGKIWQIAKDNINPPKIRNLADYMEYLHDHATRSAGGLVLSYSQKRTGKLHFKLVKEPDYANHLVRAQIALHAEIVSDLWFLTLEFLHLPRPRLNKCGKMILRDLHNEYIATAPESAVQAGKALPALENRHFAPKQQGIRDFSEKSGHILFELLPLTENLITENRTAFVNQLRSRYIGFFEGLDKRLDRDALIAELEKEMQ